IFFIVSSSWVAGRHLVDFQPDSKTCPLDSGHCRRRPAPPQHPIILFPDPHRQPDRETIGLQAMLTHTFRIRCALSGAAFVALLLAFLKISALSGGQGAVS